MHRSPQKLAAAFRGTATLAVLLAATGCQSGSFAWKTPDLQAWKFWDREKPAEAQIAATSPLSQPPQVTLPSQSATPATTTPAYPNAVAAPYAATAPGAYPATYPNMQGAGMSPGYGANTAPAYASTAPVQSGYYNPNYPQTANPYASQNPATAMPTGYTNNGNGYAAAAAYPTTTPAQAPANPQAPYPQTADARNQMVPSASTGYSTGSPYDPATQQSATGGSGSRYPNMGTPPPAATPQADRYSNPTGQPTSNEPAYQADPYSNSGVGPRYEGGPDRYSAGLNAYPQQTSSPAPTAQTPAAGSYRPGSTSDYIAPGVNQLNSTDTPSGNGGVSPAGYRTPPAANLPPEVEMARPTVFTPPSATGTG